MISDTPRTVVVVAFDDGEVLDVTGPISAFAQANLLSARSAYRVRLVAPGPRTVLSGGVTIETEPIASVRGPIDTLVTTGGTGFMAAVGDAELVRHVGRLARRARRVTSVCSGAFLLAAAGVLDGRRATTHWVAAELLAQLHPDITVDADRIYLRDGHVWTSAGVTAGIDLALALVADDLGRALAHDIARWLVLPVQRAGGQSQYSPQLASSAPRSTELVELLAWAGANLDADLSTAALARRAGWGERHLARRFRAEVGTTPAAFVESLRLDAARQLLEATDLGIDAVAGRCGFGRRETMHRAFQRRLGTTPAAYRRAFSA